MNYINQKFSLFSQTKIAPIISIILAALIWGCSFISIKVVSAEIPPFTLNLLRFSLASAVLVIFLLKSEPSFKLEKRDLGLLVLSGVIGMTMYFALETQGIKYAGASNSSMLISLVPAIAIVGEYFVFKNNIGFYKFLGVAFSITGTFFVISAGRNLNLSDESFKGNLLIILADIVWVTYISINRHLNSKYSDLAITTYQSIAGTVFFIPFCIKEGYNFSGVTTSAWINILFLGVFCSALAYLLNTYSIRKLGVTVTSVYLNLIPIVAVVMAYVFLHERIVNMHIIGGLIIITGVFLVNKEAEVEEEMLADEGVVSV